MAIEAAKLIWEWEKDETSEFYIKPEEFETAELKGFKYPLKKRDGVHFWNDIITLDAIKNLSLHDDDTFIIGYPKSGTTWIEEIVWQIRHKFNYDQAEFLFHFARVPWVDRGFSQVVAEDCTRPRCMKSHLPIRFLPENFNKKAKVVYVVRNPKDLVVSTFKFMQSMKVTEFDGTLDDMVNLFVEGKTPYGPWWEHMNEYEKLENVHIVHYEDMLENPVEITRSIAKYLDYPEITDEEIKTVLSFTAFENMKTLPSMDFKLMDPIFKDNLDFFFKGQVGNWKNFLTEEQSKKIDDMVQKHLKYSRPLQYEPTKKE